MTTFLWTWLMPTGSLMLPRAPTDWFVRGSCATFATVSLLQSPLRSISPIVNKRGPMPKPNYHLRREASSQSPMQSGKGTRFLVRPSPQTVSRPTLSDSRPLKPIAGTLHSQLTMQTPVRRFKPVDIAASSSSVRD